MGADGEVFFFEAVFAVDVFFTCDAVFAAVREAGFVDVFFTELFFFVPVVVFALPCLPDVFFAAVDFAAVDFAVADFAVADFVLPAEDLTAGLFFFDFALVPDPVLEEAVPLPFFPEDVDDRDEVVLVPVRVDFFLFVGLDAGMEKPLSGTIEVNAAIAG